MASAPLIAGTGPDPKPLSFLRQSPSRRSTLSLDHQSCAPGLRQGLISKPHIRPLSTCILIYADSGSKSLVSLYEVTRLIKATNVMKLSVKLNK